MSKGLSTSNHIYYFSLGFYFIRRRITNLIKMGGNHKWRERLLGEILVKNYRIACLGTLTTEQRKPIILHGKACSSFHSSSSKL